MFFGSPEHLKFLRYEVLSPQRRLFVIAISDLLSCENPQSDKKQDHFCHVKNPIHPREAWHLGLADSWITRAGLLRGTLFIKKNLGQVDDPDAPFNIISMNIWYVQIKRNLK